MYKIAICDDEAVICEQLEFILERIRSEFLKDIEWDVFFSGESLYKHLSMGNYYDLIFLDIELDEMNGVEVGRLIRNDMLNESTQIVYISGKEHYAMKLFKVRPLDFIRKPFEYEDIKEILKLVLKIDKTTTFQYNIGHETYNISTKNILYFESENRRIILHTAIGQDTFYGKIKDVYKKLQGYKFIQIHKSYLVNYNHIIKFQYDKLTLSNGEILPISQINRKKVRMLFLELEGEGIWG